MFIDVFYKTKVLLIFRLRLNIVELLTKEVL